MKCLSLKEIIALFELIVGGLGLFNFIIIDIYDEKLHDADIFKHRLTNLSLSFISFFYAFGTWFWFSHVRMTRMLSRFHTVMVYLIHIAFLLLTHFKYKGKYGPEILDNFDHGIFINEDKMMQINFYVCLVISILSLAIIAINIRYLVLRMIRSKKKGKSTAIPTKKR